MGVDFATAYSRFVHIEWPVLEHRDNSKLHFEVLQSDRNGTQDMVPFVRINTTDRDSFTLRHHSRS